MAISTKILFPFLFLVPSVTSLLAERLSLWILNDCRIFDYRIKCSFSISFAAHSILKLLMQKMPSARCWKVLDFLSVKSGNPG